MNKNLLLNMFTLIRVCCITILFVCSISLNTHALVYYITSDGATGESQMTAAINNANLTASKDSIYFNIPGNGPHIISFLTFLPEITEPLLIDGLTQPGNDTVNFTVRLEGKIQFFVNSNSCTIRGLRISNTQAPAIFTTAIYLTNEDPSPGTGPGFITYDWLIEMNYIENFDNAINCHPDYTNSVPTVKNLHVRANKFFNNGTAFGMFGFLGVTYEDVVVEENYFYINDQVTMIGSGQNQPLNYQVRNNYFFETILDFSGKLKNVFATDNVFDGTSQLELSTAKTDSMVISNNIFNGLSLLNIFLRDSVSRKLYITENTFESSINRKLIIDLGGNGSYQSAEGVYIKNNDFIDNTGMLLRIYVSTTTTRFANCEIADNTLSFTGGLFTGGLIDIDLVSSGGDVIADSIYIHNNILNGGAVNFSHMGSGSHSIDSERIYIRNNTLMNSANPAILFNIFRKNLRHVVIDSNYVSNSFRGIHLELQPGSGLSASVNDVRITDNTITGNADCGISIRNIPQNGHSEMDSIFIANNIISANTFDGVQLWCLMQNSIYLNEMKNITVTENSIYDNNVSGIDFTVYGDTFSILASPVLQGMTYTRNSIFDNGYKGITITNDNNPFLPPSPVFPVPVVTGLLVSPSDFTVNGNIQGEPATVYNIEIFRNLFPDLSGSGEGEVFLADQLVTTDNTGFAQFQVLNTGAPGLWYYSATATNTATGNTSEFSNATDILIGVNELELTSGLTISPNPASSALTVELNMERNQFVQCTIADISGKEVMNLFEGYVHSGSNRYQFNIAGLEKGIYFFHVNGDRTFVKKIAKL